MMRHACTAIFGLFFSFALIAQTTPVKPDPQIEVLKARLDAQQLEADIQRQQIEANA